ncbi:MAG: RNA-binding protein [Rhodospirillaceae bacterium]
MPKFPNDPARSERSLTNRRCILTRRTLPRTLMLRFVVGPDDLVTFDPDAVLPGRGLWLCPHRDVLETASSKGSFTKAAKSAVTVPADLADRVEALLMERCVGLLGFARKAGKAVSGFQKVRSWLRADGAGLVLAATDGSSAEIDRLGAAARGLPQWVVLDRATLGQAFGREDAVHVAIAPGAFTEKLGAALERLANYRKTGLAPRKSTRHGAGSGSSRPAPITRSKA